MVDYSDDNFYEQALENICLFASKIVRMPPPSQTSSTVNLGQAKAPTEYKPIDTEGREETQLFQWMARATKIEESRRIVYCASFVQKGITSVEKLAKKMTEHDDYLTSVGVTEFDSDELAIAVSDLGYGYNPVRDFKHASSIESAAYALRKSAAAPNDHTLAASALACVKRIVEMSPDTPQKMCDGGFVDAIVKTMFTHLNDCACVEAACRALSSIAEASLDIIEYMGEHHACVMIPRAMQSHFLR